MFKFIKKLFGYNDVGTIYLNTALGPQIVTVYRVKGNYECNYAGNTVRIFRNGRVEGRDYIKSWSPRTWNYSDF